MAAVNVRIDEELKVRADEVFGALNVSATEAITRLYRYVVDHGSLPFDNPLAVLRQMQEEVNKAVGIAIEMNLQRHRLDYMSVADWDAHLVLFSTLIRRLEENTGTLRAACGGTLSCGWENAANSLKGLCWMLSSCTKPVPGGLFFTENLNTPINDLSESYRLICSYPDADDRQ